MLASKKVIALALEIDLLELKTCALPSFLLPSCFSCHNSFCPAGGSNFMFHRNGELTDQLAKVDPACKILNLINHTHNKSEQYSPFSERCTNIRNEFFGFMCIWVSLFYQLLEFGVYCKQCGW